MKDIQIIRFNKGDTYIEELKRLQNRGYRVISEEPIVELVGMRVTLERDIMVFEIGKYYKHTTGHQIHIISEIETTLRGRGLLAETNGHDELCVVGIMEENAVGYTEITREEWMKNFS